jgi:hypothetical protein
MHVRVAREIGNPITVVDDGEDTRIVVETLLPEDL